MSIAYRVRGDVNDFVDVTLSGVQDLTNVSAVEGHVALDRTKVNLAAAVTDPVARTVRVQLGGAVGGWLRTAEPGSWKLEIEATFLDGTILTWPAASTDTIVVRKDYDA